MAMRGPARLTSSIDPSFKPTPRRLLNPEGRTRIEIIFKQLGINSIKVRRTPVAMEPAAGPDIRGEP
jgi:hypothetical protein